MTKMAYSSLTYATLLIALDPKTESKDHPGIHPWVYVNKLKDKHPNLIRWGKFLKRLPGTRTQVLRITKQIGEYLATQYDVDGTLFFLTHNKLDYKTIKELSKDEQYRYFNNRIDFNRFTDPNNYETILNYLIELVHHADSFEMYESKHNIYQNKFNIPEFSITLENHEKVLKMLYYYPRLAILPWMKDIQKYIDIKEFKYIEITMYLYTNPYIDQNLFKQFTEVYKYTDPLMNRLLMPKLILNMFQFKMQKGLGIELHYPHCGIPEYTFEWRMKLYELNLGLIDSGVLDGCGELISAIPGRHSQYLRYSYLDTMYELSDARDFDLIRSLLA